MLTFFKFLHIQLSSIGVAHLTFPSIFFRPSKVTDKVTSRVLHRTAILKILGEIIEKQLWWGYLFLTCSRSELFGETAVLKKAIYYGKLPWWSLVLMKSYGSILFKTLAQKNSNSI